MEPETRNLPKVLKPSGGTGEGLEGYELTFLPMMLRALHPVLAALAMAFSSVSVVTNSLRLKRVRL